MFPIFQKELTKRLTQFLKSHTNLYFAGVDRDLLWQTYLNSFPPGTNPIYKTKSEFDCSTCRRFIKGFGHVVAIKGDFELESIWDFETSVEMFKPVVASLAAFVRTAPIKDAFITRETLFGAEVTREEIGGEIRRWDHMFVKLPQLNTTVKSNEQVMGDIRDSRNVLKRSLDEVPIATVDVVLDLIRQGTLYKGEEWRGVLEDFMKIQKDYAKVSNKELFTWKKSREISAVISRIRNHSIGVLLQDISADMDLDEAVRRYESVVAPTNYKRPKAIFTKKMLEDAQKTVVELGLQDSLGRRFAVLDDITVDNILFCNRDSAKRISGSVFDDLAKDLPAAPKNLDKVEEIGIDQFLEKVLPTATEIEAMFEGRQAGNLVSLIAPIVPGSKPLFKWNNGFSWAYSGNITDSIKERVKSAGGKVDGVLRFSIQWNDAKDNEDDLDAHCQEPGKSHIYYRNKWSETGGKLDVDIIHPSGNIAVENITWADTAAMREGTYQFSVECFNSTGARSGFTAEIEFDGQLFQFTYPRPLKNKEVVPVADVKWSKRDRFSIVSKLDPKMSSRDIWGIKTNQLHPVQVVMFSPNYWDRQEGIGHRHVFFMLKGCANDSTPNGFFNEFLREEFMAHKRVFEALGNKLRVEPSKDQLSGLGFSATKRDSLVVKVSGSFNRMLKIMF